MGPTKKHTHFKYWLVIRSRAYILPWRVVRYLQKRAGILDLIANSSIR
jgi:hypothetical protein